jgi:HEAT repeat protein
MVQTKRPVRRPPPLDPEARRLLAQYAGLLTSPEEEVRQAAVAVLKQQGAPAMQNRLVGALVRALGGEDEGVSRRAAASLAEVGRPALGALTDALYDCQDVGRRVKVVEVVGGIARSDRTALLRLLDLVREEPDAAVRDAALAALARLGVVLRSPWPRRPGHPSLPG